jgi:hypothetical protein
VGSSTGVLLGVGQKQSKTYIYILYIIIYIYQQLSTCIHINPYQEQKLGYGVWMVLVTFLRTLWIELLGNDKRKGWRAKKQ